MTGDLQRWQLEDAAAAGVHRIDRAEVEPLCAAGQAAGLYGARLDLVDCRNKADLLAGLARVFKFPSWFGHNWDALADCLDDLEWLRASGYLLVLENPAGVSSAARKNFEVMLDILAHAARKWGERGTPFWVFVVGPDR
jgi:RNAse (barnase) inhibitor barstar